MNQRGRDMFVGAAVEELPQLRRAVVNAGMSASALLLSSVGCLHLHLPLAWFNSPENLEEHDRCFRRASRRYGLTREEWGELRRENDELEWDFLTIAAYHGRASVDATTQEVAWPTVIKPAPRIVPLRPVLTEVRELVVAPSTMKQEQHERRGYQKPCRDCQRQIFIHLDDDREWRPYESWHSGLVARGEWRLHRCPKN